MINIINKFDDMLIRDIVAANFHTSELFEKYGIDFCCKGNRPLNAACAEKGIDQESLINELQKIMSQDFVGQEDYDKWDLTFLSQYITNFHHSYVRRSIPKITAHLEKVLNAHGSRHPYIKEVQDSFFAVAAELKNHMFKEENILFPAIKSMEEAEKEGERPASNGFGSIRNPINMMEREHTSAGNELSTMRELTGNYMPPADACPTFTLLYKELDEFEKDLHKHIHLENNILFPKAIELENTLNK
ncbi:MAG TPA: iron-sulfur cluster repair di-iron protein [Ignavibacteriales bacterium]|nr:iron-sulfur cluster repair di-iron protein [Ignavibacteriales bacterium]